MGIFTKIHDAVTKQAASIIKPSGEKTGFNVLTRPAKFYNNQIKFFTNEIYGANMAVDADTLIQNELIHDGIDIVAWAGAALSGVWDFNSVAQAHSPTHSVDATGTVNGDTAEFLRGAGILVLADPISAIGVWIYLTGWSPAVAIRQILLSGWDTTIPGQVGNDVDLADYIDVTLLGVWQHAIVPLNDMNLQERTIDSVRIQTINNLGPVPNYYLDDMEVLEGDPPIEYTVEPAIDTHCFVDSVNINMVDAYTAILADASMPVIPYNSFLGVPLLAGGIIYQRIENDKTILSAIVHQLFDFIKLPGAEIVGFGSDGTNTWVSMKIVTIGEVRLKSETNDKLKITLSDDLSGLLEFQISVGCREEIRQGDLYE